MSAPEKRRASDNESWIEDAKDIEKSRLLDVRLHLIEEAARMKPQGSSMQWASLVIAFLLLIVAAWGITQSLESRITRLETTVEVLAREVSLLRTEVRP